MTTLTLVRQATAAVAITAALTLPAVTARAQEAVFGRGVYWFHNDSAMTILRDSRSLQIRYADPRSGLGRHGIRRGTVLFRGQITGRRIRGTAYTFKRGCQPASYNVSGRLVSEGYGVNTIVLNGAAPVREGCEVVGYTRNSSNARLEFGYGGTGD